MEVETGQPSGGGGSVFARTISRRSDRGDWLATGGKSRPGVCERQVNGGDRENNAAATGTVRHPELKSGHCISGHCASGQLSQTGFLAFRWRVPVPSVRQGPHGLSLSDWGRPFLTTCARQSTRRGGSGRRLLGRRSR